MHHVELHASLRFHGVELSGRELGIVAVSMATDKLDALIPETHPEISPPTSLRRYALRLSFFSQLRDMCVRLLVPGVGI